MQLLLAALLLGQVGGDASPPSSHEPLVAINAGGPRTTTAEGLIYEADRSGRTHALEIGRRSSSTNISHVVATGSTLGASCGVGAMDLHR